MEYATFQTSSLFASNGVWGHYVVVCFSDTSEEGTSCAGAPSTWSGFGGTSVATPVMASMQALVNQYQKLTKIGNPHPLTTQLRRPSSARAEYRLLLD